MVLDQLDLPALGITRIGDHTGLDIVGLPVWFAARPNSRGLAVSQGKGMTDEQARLSAAMEAVETAYAERCETLVRFVGSLDDLTAQGLAAVPFERLLRTASAQVDPRRIYAWVPGTVLGSGVPVYAPYDLVGIDYREGDLWDHESFHMTSIGLAAHGDRDRAIRHALFEVIENDATAALEIFGFSERLAEPLPEIAGSTELEAALGKVTAAGLTVRFCRLRGAVDLPVIGCFVGRDVAGPGGNGVAYTAGFACRVDIADAALAALLEAVQSRLTDIAGARDDILAEAFTPASYDIGAQLPETRLAGRQQRPTGDPDTTTAALQAAGIDEVYVFDLAPPGPVSVVRVLVPDLQSPGSASQLRLGLTAARQFLA